jgi:hypothetical protein
MWKDPQIPAAVALSAAIHLDPPILGRLHQFLLHGVHYSEGPALKLVDLDEAEGKAVAGPDC